ncbi:MAG: hypothetical protein HEP71_00870 [Roseivirga sp.]|nr:hypothetical protein [Roseivirga sp.]
MEKHLELSDEEFLRQFTGCHLDPSIFSHEAHLRLAWINITKYGIVQATENIQSQLLKFVESVGDSDKYNKTLTIASMFVVNHFIQRSESSNFPDFISEFSKLKTGLKSLISSHYSIDVFTSQKAKEEYLEPDLLPFE